MRFRLRTLFLLFFVAAIFLSTCVPLVRWMNSRPGTEVTDYAGEVADIQRNLGPDVLKELKIWHLYGFFEFNYLWTAKAPPEVIACLIKSMQLKPISERQMPAEFWQMSPERSEIPSWWKPNHSASAEYHMSPTFVPGFVTNDGVDGVVMYDPVEQRVWVWSQFDF